MFEEARKLGDRLVVIVNNDNWLRRKKGYVFIPEDQRVRIIKALRYVDEVVLTNHDVACADPSVCRELSLLNINVFANGGDRVADNVPEVDLCKRMGIEMVFNVGGEKVESSSDLVNKAMSRVMAEERPWGTFTLLQKHRKWWAKIVYIKPGGKLSLQRHAKRDEVWLCVEGEAHAESGSGTPHELKVGGPPIRVSAGVWHRLSSKDGAKIIEIALGEPVETDIERKEDDYGRA